MVLANACTQLPVTGNIQLAPHYNIDSGNLLRWFEANWSPGDGHNRVGRFVDQSADVHAAEKKIAMAAAAHTVDGDIERLTPVYVRNVVYAKPETMACALVVFFTSYSLTIDSLIPRGDVEDDRY